jgi:hypothetical protein
MPSLLCVALLATSLSAQAASDPPVLFKPLGIENLNVGLGGGSFDLLVEVQRTRGLAVRLRSLDYTVKMGGRVVTSGDREYSGKRISKRDPVIVEIPVNFSAADALTTGIDALASGKINAKVKGEAGLAWFIFPFKVPFDRKVSLDTAPKKKRKGR